MSTASGVYWLGLWLSLLCVAATLTGCGWLWSPNTSDLYSAQNCAFVNGQSEATIAPRIIDCLIDVLVKVSGDPTVADDLKRSAFASSAHDYVTKLTYRDFMEGLPIGDEQGTRDRPFFLTVTFAPARIDALLNALSRKPWMGPRPRIVVILGESKFGRDTVLTTDSDWGVDQRSALFDAAQQMGLSSILPAKTSPSIAELTYETVKASAPADFTAVATGAGGDLPMVGTISWDDGARVWRADWRLDHGGRTYGWGTQSVTFDEAFRAAMRDALQILSGHGAPIEQVRQQ